MKDLLVTGVAEAEEPCIALAAGDAQQRRGVDDQLILAVERLVAGGPHGHVAPEGPLVDELVPVAEARPYVPELLR